MKTLAMIIAGLCCIVGLVMLYLTLDHPTMERLLSIPIICTLAYVFLRIAEVQDRRERYPYTTYLEQHYKRRKVDGPRVTRDQMN